MIQSSQVTYSPCSLQICNLVNRLNCHNLPPLGGLCKWYFMIN
ncbi:hypothetical protein [Moraxella lacunata]